MLKLLTRSVALLAVTLTLCFSVVAGAVDIQQMEPFYTGIASMQPSVVISSSGSANCLDKVLLKSGYTANVTWTLQRQVGNTWVSNVNWSGSGKTQINLNKNYFVTHGYTYRLKTVATVYNSNGGVVETATKYSSSVNF